ncbi:hypothetical protein NVP1121O_090 [Vibrio phage 1.121.O._10N.286.46.C4]|nr:hypothetical protein NVP1121O_090 [Vibrio phage 1.121.O._10N.286.46.C4]
MVDKIKIEEMRCFNRVAAVIGTHCAKVELFKVVQNLAVVDKSWEDRLRYSRLYHCFDWRETPQGYTFWNNIYFSRNPYER